MVFVFRLCSTLRESLFYLLITKFVKRLLVVTVHSRWNGYLRNIMIKNNIEKKKRCRFTHVR